MHFISPLNLLWLPLIGSLIIVMYILKLRRKDVIVSSTYLWQQVIRDVQANAPFQKLRKNILLLLQLILAALLIFALARPFLRAYGLGGRNIVLIVDTSASMRATDVSPSRLEAARREAHTIVNDLHPGDQMMVISAYSKPEAVTGFTRERAELHRAIDSLKPHDTPTNMRDALNLAADLVAARKDADNGLIELVSDGGFESQDSDAHSANGPQYALANLNIGKTRVLFHPIGKGHENVGITAVNARRNLGQDKTIQLLVVTHNFGAGARTFNEEIYAGDNLVEAHEIHLAPNGEDTQPYDLPEPGAQITLRVHLDIKDDLSVDNDASLLISPRKTVKVLLVGKENLFLEKAIQVDPGVELSRTEAFTSGKGFDVVAFLDSAPPKLPEGDYLFLHCVSDQAPVRVDGSVANVAAADWEHDDPILRYVELSDERFGSALKATPLAWGRELAVGESGSLIVAGEKGRTRAEFVAFSLSETMFPLRVAFPIFISNSIRWLAGGEDRDAGQVATGSPVSIPAPPGLNRLTITMPDGSQREVSVGERGGAVFDETDQVGVYTAKAPNFSYSFAANLASASESDITPHRKLAILDNPAGVAGHRVADNHELLPWLVTLALVMLGVEWWVFHRRAFIN